MRHGDCLDLRRLVKKVQQSSIVIVRIMLKFHKTHPVRKAGMKLFNCSTLNDFAFVGTGELISCYQNLAGKMQISNSCDFFDLQDLRTFKKNALQLCQVVFESSLSRAEIIALNEQQLKYLKAFTNFETRIKCTVRNDHYYRLFLFLQEKLNHDVFFVLASFIKQVN